jgi:hypothetical protein
MRARLPHPKTQSKVHRCNGQPWPRVPAASRFQVLHSPYHKDSRNRATARRDQPSRYALRVVSPPHGPGMTLGDLGLDVSASRIARALAISASVFLRTRALRAECTERTRMGAAPASTSATSHIGTAEPTYGSCDLVRSRCGLGRHHERDDVLARFEARSILRRGMLRRKRTHAHAVPRATTWNFGFENVGLVTTRP